MNQSTMIANLVKAHEDHLPSVLEEIGTNPEQLKKDVAAFREWYTYQTHLPQNIEDTVLATFIVGCKNSMEIAKMKLDMFYSERRRYSEIYQGCDPTSQEILTSYKTVYTVSVPGLTPDGTSVCILRLRNLDPALYSPLEPIKRLNMMYELLIQRMTMTSKNYIIYDYENSTNAHITKIKPLQIKTQLETMKFLPIRVKGLICINCPSLAEKTYNVFKTFLSDKLKSRYHIYSEGVSVLSKHIPAEILPRDYGGTADYTLEQLNDLWHDTLVNNRGWFVDEAIHNSDESKRPADSKYKPEETLGGVDGSFKQLNID